MPGPNDRENIDDEEDVLEVEDEGSDAGSLDDEGGDDAETGQEPEDAQGQERLGRAGKRIQSLREAAQRERERAAQLERELAQERQQRQQPQQPREETNEEFEAKLALVENFEDRTRMRLERSEKRHQRELLMLRLQTADATDKAAFTAKAAYDPYVKKYANEVEQLLAEERRQGRDYPRETVLDFIIGRAARTNPNRGKQKQAGQDRIRREQARADSGRSDVERGQRTRLGQGNTLADLEYRLRDVNI